MDENRKKIKVLEVIYGFGYGGIRAFIMNYLKFLNKDKFDIDIYVFGWDSSPFTAQVRELGANIYFNPENNANGNIPKFIYQLYSFMKHNGPYDVVHAHNNLISAWVLTAARMANIPVRLPHSHTTDHFGPSKLQRLYSNIRRNVLRRIATKNLACGQLAGEAMYGKDVPFEIVANGINLERFISPNLAGISKLRRKLDIPVGARVYANVTRLDTPKNHMFAIDVFNKIHEKDSSAIFVYGGVCPKISSTETAVKEKIREYGLEKYCRFTGPLMNIEDLYHLSDVWIYCSIYEGLPFGPIELQASGTPTLASDVITQEIDLGLGLVEFLPLEESPEAWADKAMSLRKRHIPADRIRKAFQDYNYDILNNVKKLESIYEGDA